MSKMDTQEKELLLEINDKSDDWLVRKAEKHAKRTGNMVYFNFWGKRKWEYFKVQQHYVKMVMGNY